MTEDSQDQPDNATYASIMNKFVVRPSSDAANSIRSQSIPPADRIAGTESLRGRKRRTRLIESESPADYEPTVKKRKKRKEKVDVDVEAEFDKQWICAECKEAECALIPNAEHLLVCEGSCRRLFHYPCVNLKRLPTEEEPFFCVDCKNNRHRCAICQDYGQDDTDLFKCKRDDCGFFFHEGCLAIRNINFTYKSIKAATCGETNDSSENAEESSLSGVPVFECPAHRCWTCATIKAENATENDIDTIKPVKRKAQASSSVDCKKGDLFCCIECPRSYHLTCIPPTARLHELAMLCHEHATTCKLPHLDKDSSVQRAIESKVDQKFFDDKKTPTIPRRRTSCHNPLFLGYLSRHRSKRELLVRKELMGLPEVSEIMFCLPVTIRDDVYAMPPTYRHIQVNKINPDNAPPRIPLGEPCHCREKCSEDCLNRLTYIECTSKNCKLGPSCGNRRISQRRVPKCKVKRERGKGWGLVTLEAVRKGDLVQEYIGEIIDEKEKQSRLTQWSIDHPNDPNFYIMANAPGWFIDARFTSNLSRFINHSCEPNCILTTFNVNGVIRNGIFALQDIEAGEFLSYDYNFDTLHNDKFNCRCGAATCRGTLKYTGQRREENINKTKTQVWEDARAAYERDKKFVEELMRDEFERRSQVSASVPGSINNDELVANGPQRQKHRRDAIKGHIFLWRNVEIGSNFAGRTRRFSKEKMGMNYADDES